MVLIKSAVLTPSVVPVAIRSLDHPRSLYDILEKMAITRANGGKLGVVFQWFVGHNTQTDEHVAMVIGRQVTSPGQLSAPATTSRSGYL